MADNALWLASTQENQERIEPLDIAELLTNSAEIYRAMIEKRGNTLNLKIPYSPPSVSGSADQLIQMMANLLTNANTHTEDGKINVELIVDSGEMRVIVTDTGTGISPELLPRIFARGVTGSDGAGIGLEICKNIIESHGGTIGIESEPGKGTTVAFTLPFGS
jgi:signal transduction histidine kinase